MPRGRCRQTTNKADMCFFKVEVTMPQGCLLPQTHADEASLTLALGSDCASVSAARLRWSVVQNNAAKQVGAQRFYRRAAHATKKLCFGGQIRRSRTRRVRKHPRGRPLPGRGVSDAPINAE